MFTRWGDFAFRFRRIIPAVIIVLIGVLYLGIGTQLDDRMSQEGWEDRVVPVAWDGLACQKVKVSGGIPSGWSENQTVSGANNRF